MKRIALQSRKFARISVHSGRYLTPASTPSIKLITTFKLAIKLHFPYCKGTEFGNLVMEFLSKSHLKKKKRGTDDMKLQVMP